MTKNISLNSKQDKNTPQTTSNSTFTDDSVIFINEQVLKPDANPMSVGAKQIADQAAAMMVQDMRSFLQGNEQVLTIAIARSLNKVVESDGADGSKALAICEELLLKLPKFAEAIGASAGSIITEFKDA